MNPEQPNPEEPENNDEALAESRRKMREELLKGKSSEGINLPPISEKPSGASIDKYGQIIRSEKPKKKGKKKK